MEKDELRRRAMSLREGMRPEARAALSSRICRRIRESGLLDGARSVMVYAAVRGEVDLSDLVTWLWERERDVAFPLVNAAEREMVPVCVRDVDELEPGAYGIPSPPPSGRVLEPEELDVVIIPGLAFDRDGHRLGYGGGYYDRFLPKLSGDVLRLGVVYHALLWSRLPIEAFDQSVDWVVTERETAGPMRKR